MHAVNCVFDTNHAILSLRDHLIHSLFSLGGGGIEPLVDHPTCFTTTALRVAVRSTTPTGKVGLEPTASSLTVRRSAIELLATTGHMGQAVEHSIWGAQDSNPQPSA